MFTDEDVKELKDQAQDMNDFVVPVGSDHLLDLIARLEAAEKYAHRSDELLEFIKSGENDILGNTLERLHQEAREAWRKACGKDS